MGAGQREIVLGIGPVVLASNDVIEVMGEAVEILVDLAILAVARRSAPDSELESGLHFFAALRGSAARALAFSRLRRFPTRT